MTTIDIVFARPSDPLLLASAVFYEEQQAENKMKSMNLLIEIRAGTTTAK